ncbi:MAG: exosortase A [Vicinamibacterales bacterium]
MNRRALVISGTVAAAAFVVLYWHVLLKLVGDWSRDENYSHGFLIVPLAMYFAWERRKTLASAAPAPSLAGLFVLAGSLALLVAGTLGAELFVSRISMLGTVAGIVLFAFGKEHLRILGFPIAFLFLMIPLPAIVFNQIAFPLQLLASRFGEMALQVLRIPVLREGNVIIMANTRLEVAEACSGIRSLISLLTLGITLGYFTDSRWLMRTMIAMATIPVAIFANGLRVAGTGIAAHYVGAAAATGFLHTFSGWLMFVLASLLLFAIQRGGAWVFPPTSETLG